jgi:hypothetical protein
MYRNNPHLYSITSSGAGEQRRQRKLPRDLTLVVSMLLLEFFWEGARLSRQPFATTHFLVFRHSNPAGRMLR